MSRGPIQRSCFEKQWYATKQEAQSALAQRRKHGCQARLHVYRCDFGPHYHLGHIRGAVPR